MGDSLPPVSKQPPHCQDVCCQRCTINFPRPSALPKWYADVTVTWMDRGRQTGNFHLVHETCNLFIYSEQMDLDHTVALLPSVLLWQNQNALRAKCLQGMRSLAAGRGGSSAPTVRLWVKGLISRYKNNSNDLLTLTSAPFPPQGIDCATWICS